jgi:sugar lactone lactonase YvrE
MSPEIKTWTVTEPYLDTQCALGEAPYYEPATNTLRFVDVKKKQLHTVDLTAGPASLKTLQLDMPVGVTANIEGVDPQEKILVGGKSGIYILERQTGKYKLLKRYYDTEENDERLRSNDGTVDPQGRFWVGTMNDFWVGEPQAEGECIPMTLETLCTAPSYTTSTLISPCEQMAPWDHNNQSIQESS